MEKLEERRQSVQQLFRPDGSLTYIGKFLFESFFEGRKRLAGRDWAGEPPSVVLGGWSEEGMRTVRRTFLPEGHGLSRRSKLSDPFAGDLIRNHFMGEVRGPRVKLAFKKEGWGSLLEEHPRGCLAYRLTALGGKPVLEAALILPHPCDQVSKEHKMHAFELEGGGLAKWTQSGLELTPGKIVYALGGEMKFLVRRHYTPAEEDGRRAALWEASGMRGASHEGLSTLAQRLQLQGFEAMEPLHDWDPHLKNRARAEVLLQAATLALAHHAAPLLFRDPHIWDNLTHGAGEVIVRGQPHGGMRLAPGEQTTLRLGLDWGKRGVPSGRRFEDHQEPSWRLSRASQGFFEGAPLPTPCGRGVLHDLDTDKGFAAFCEELTEAGMKHIKQYFELQGW